MHHEKPPQAHLLVSISFNLTSFMSHTYNDGEDDVPNIFNFLLLLHLHNHSMTIDDLPYDLFDFTSKVFKNFNVVPQHHPHILHHHHPLP